MGKHKIRKIVAGNRTGRGPGLALTLCGAVLSSAAASRAHAQSAANFTANGSAGQPTTISLTTIENQNPNIAFSPSPPFDSAAATTSGGGRVSVGNDGSLTYQPAAGFTGNDSFTYAIETNEHLQTAPGTITVSIPVPPAPVAGGTTVDLPNAGGTINIAQLDTGAITSARIVTVPVRGTATVTSAGTVNYVPASEFSQFDSFTYTVSGPGGTSNTATVNITLDDPGPFAPTANGGNASTTENSPVTIAVGNFANGGPFTSVAVAGQPNHGTAVANGLNVVYSPVSNFVGTDTFTYMVTNTVATSQAAIVTVTVTQPVPVAVNQAFVTPLNTPVTLNVTANDSFGPFTAIAIASGPSHGTATVNGLNIAYTPTQGFKGSDSLTYTVTNATGTSTPGTVTISVPSGAPVPVGTNVTTTTTTNHAVTVDVSKGATNGPFTAAAVSGAPKNGTVAVSGTLLTYTPNANFTGTDNFTYTLSNSVGASAPANVTVTILPLAVPIAMSVTTAENAPITIDPTKNAAGGPFTATAIATPPSHGTATVNGLSIVYRPAANFVGNDTFTFTLTNATGTSAPQVVAVSVNNLPTPKAVATTTTANTPVTVDLSQGATGGPFTGAAIVTAPPASAGTAVLHGLLLTFTPNQTFAGTTSLTFTLSNAAGPSAPVTLTITVDPRPSPATDPSVVGVVNSQLEAARRFYQTQIANFNRRLDELHANAHGFSFGGLGVSSPNQPPANSQSSNQPPGSAVVGIPPTGSQQAAAPGDATAPNGTLGSLLKGGGASADDELPDRLGVFVNGLVNVGSRGSTATSQGFGFSTSGISAGADYRFTDSFILGIGGGYSGDTDDIGTDGSKSTADAFNVTLYGTYQATDKLYVDGILAYGSLGFDSRRLSSLTDQFASGRRGGDDVYGAITAGYEMTDESVNIAPYVRLNASSATLNRFTETGGGIGALTYNAQAFSDFSTTLGIRADDAISLEDAILSPHFRFEYDHEFAGYGQTSVLFADQPNAAFGLTPDPVVRNYFTVGLGANYLMENALSFFVDYEALLGYSHEQSHTITFGVSKRF